MNAAELPADVLVTFARDVSELRPGDPKYGTVERSQRARWIADGSLVPASPDAPHVPTTWERQQPFLALDNAGRRKAARALAGLDNDDPKPRRW
jgi:hypothetical protein